MMLMFRLGRPDVLPVDDLGIRKGAQVVDKAEAMPAPKALLERGERWGPYRTYASLYLWRIADAGDDGHDADQAFAGMISRQAGPPRQHQCQGS